MSLPGGESMKAQPLRLAGDMSKASMSGFRESMRALCLDYMK